MLPSLGLHNAHWCIMRTTSRYLKKIKTDLNMENYFISSNYEKRKLITTLRLGLWYLTPHSTIFQLNDYYLNRKEVT